MGYSNEELQMLGESESGDWWDSRRMSLGAGFEKAVFDKAVAGRAVSNPLWLRGLRGRLKGRQLPLSAISKQVSASGATFVGEENIGAVFLGNDGGVYAVDDMGFIAKAYRGVKKGVSSATKQVGRTAKGLVKNPVAELKKGVKTASKVAVHAAHGATYVQRQALHGAAWASFAPIRLIVNKIIDGSIKGAGRKGVKLNYAQAKDKLYAQLSKSRNPILKGAVALLKEYGPGTSAKVRILGDGDEMGAALGPAVVAALSSALAAATPALIKAVTDSVTAQATQAVSKAIAPAEPMTVTPSDAAVDNALDPSPAESDSVGWEIGCCA